MPQYVCVLDVPLRLPNLIVDNKLFTFSSAVDNAKMIEPGFDMMTDAQQKVRRAHQAFMVGASSVNGSRSRRKSAFAVMLPLDRIFSVFQMCLVELQAIVAEVEATVKSIYATHGKGAWKGKLMVKDSIADITLQQVLTRAKDFDVIATMNLNGEPVGNVVYSCGTLICVSMNCHVFHLFVAFRTIILWLPSFRRRLPVRRPGGAGGRHRHRAR